MIAWPWAVALGAALLLSSAGPFLSYAGANPGALSAAASLRLCAGYLLDALCAAALLLGCAGLGRRLLDRWGPKELNGAERFAAAAVLGQAGVASGLMLLGWAGFFARPLLAVLACALAGVALLDLSRLPWARLRADLARRYGLAAWLCAAVLSAALLRGAIAACAPPTDWDSLVYHLSFPKRFLAEGRLLAFESVLNGRFPLNAEMLYALAMSARGELAAQWLNLANGLLLLCLTFAAAARRAGSGAGLFAAAILAVQPVFQRGLGTGATDHAGAAAILGALLCAARAGSSAADWPRWALLSGALCGAAMAAKINGSWAVAVLGAAWLWRRRPGEIGRFAAAALLFGGLWPLRNLIETGNPVWPLLADRLGGGPAALASWSRLSAAVTEGVERSPLNLLLLPFLLGFKPQLFRHEPQYLVVPLLAAAPLVALSRLRWAEGRRLAALALGYGLIWFLVYQHWRFLLPVAALMAAALAAAGAELWRAGGRGRLVQCAAVAALLPAFQLTVNNQLFGVLGARSAADTLATPRDRYLEVALGPYYRLCRSANQLLPAEAKILLWRDPRGYYLEREYAWGDPINPGVLDYAATPDARALHGALLARGFTHMVYNPAVGGYQGDQAYYARATALVDGMLEKHAALVTRFGPTALFDLRAAPASR